MQPSHLSTQSVTASARVFQKFFRRLISPKFWQPLETWMLEGRGRNPVLNVEELAGSLVYHGMMEKGALEGHVKELTGKSISGAALSQWRQSLPIELFERITTQALQPAAELSRHPAAFYKGLRLVGLDGTCMSANNTPGILRRWCKAASRRFRAAFAKVGMVMLVEIGLHNPIAIRVGRRQQSEYELGKEVAQQLPAASLALADRLYGVPSFAAGFLSRCLAVKSHFLTRVRKNLTARALEVLSDGSAIVELRLPLEGGQKFRFLVREIRGVVRNRGGQRVSVRLWTSLMDARRDPADELLALYFQRWEVESTFKEMKVVMYGGRRLRSQTVETACQEILALVLALSMLAQIRAKAACASEMPPLRVSFAQTLRHVRALWLTLSVAGDCLSPKKVEQIIAAFLERMNQWIVAPRRRRSCPRAVRQPVCPWPRLIRRTEQHGDFTYEIKPIHNSIS